MAIYERLMYDTVKPVSLVDKARVEKDYPTGDYLVLDDESADLNCKGQILESLWAFRPEFLSGITGLDSAIFEKLSSLCEDANEAVKALVKSTCGIEHLVEQAISADGRGHFLAAYDNEEIEYTTRKGRKLFLYRTN
jgi:hypothetical protein